MPRLNPSANADAMFFHVKVNFEEKHLVLTIEKFPFLALARNTIMLQHLIIHFSLHYLSSGRLKAKENFKLSTLKVVAVAYERYKRFQIE